MRQAKNCVSWLQQWISEAQLCFVAHQFFKSFSLTTTVRMLLCLWCYGSAAFSDPEASVASYIMTFPAASTIGLGTMSVSYDCQRHCAVVSGNECVSVEAQPRFAGTDFLTPKLELDMNSECFSKSTTEQIVYSIFYVLRALKSTRVIRSVYRLFKTSADDH